MRLWSLHPSLLDRAALVAGWREGLLAQAVLAGRTKGYTRHPQLARFQALPGPLPAVALYLHGLREEATTRGYRFDATRILEAPAAPSITVTTGQLEYELAHLRAKVAHRQPDWLPRVDAARAHPMFTVIPGEVEPWERP